MKREVTITTRTSVIIENIATVRQIQKYLEDPDLSTDLVSLLNGFKSQIKAFFPDVPWQKPRLDRPGAELFLVPDRTWEVCEKEAVSICFSLALVQEPCFFDDKDDPFVSVFVPNTWDYSESFSKRLEQEVLKGWERRGDNSEYDERYPLWRYIGFSKYATDNRFDVDGFYDEVSRAVRDLLDLKPLIDRLLEESRI
jgi:hypothetical protein